MSERPKWYAVYTKPRWEKKVNSLLQGKGIEAYCPLNKVKRKWSDRIKTVEEPLFKSYVFVRVTEDAKTSVRMTDGVVNFVYWLGKPAIVRDSEIIAIKKFLDEYEDVIVEATDIKPNQKVRIDSGVFMDYEADVIGVHKNIATVRIDSLGYKLIARVPIQKLRKN
jgi:transcription antitermination factor NusG